MRSLFAIILIILSLSIVPATADGGPEMTNEDIQAMVDALLHTPEEVQEIRRVQLEAAEPSTDPAFVNGCPILIRAFVKFDLISHDYDGEKVSAKQLNELGEWIVTTKEIDDDLGAAILCHATLKAGLGK